MRTRPRIEYDSRITRYASTSDHPASRRKPTTSPAIRAPVAVATEPTRLYQAYVLVRRAAGVTSVSDACSIGRNGPTSAPDGLNTPIVAVTRST